ncbi:MAG TPA: hypothetical protein VGL46_18625 [Pseudonocardiaceae bacterium]
MTTTGVRCALAVLPSWRWSALYVSAFVATMTIKLAADAIGPLAGAAIGYAIAGPLGALAGLMIGTAAHDGRLFSLVSGLLDDGADRLGRAVNRAAAEAADVAVAAPACGPSRTSTDRYAEVDL